jgi:glucose/mannose-6-phosphate isomerase
MNLDDENHFHALDSQHRIDLIQRAPDQLMAAWLLGQSLEIPSDFQFVQKVLIVGMGSMVTGAELAAAYAGRFCALPISVWRQEELPAWARGPETLVIACSQSGETFETLSAFSQARSLGCCTLALTTGGKLAEQDSGARESVWRFPDPGLRATAYTSVFGLSLALFQRLGWIPDQDAELSETLVALRTLQASLVPENPVVQNPAKRMAGQLLDRWAVFFAAEDMRPIARHWKEQVNLTAKAWAQFETLPDIGHTSLAGLNHPENGLSQMMALFLTAPTNSPYAQKCLELTRQMFLLQGINTDLIAAQGPNRLAHFWTLVIYGDYVAYYLAMANGEDPTLIDPG